MKDDKLFKRNICCFNFHSILYRLNDLLYRFNDIMSFKWDICCFDFHSSFLGSISVLINNRKGSALVFIVHIYSSFLPERNHFIEPIPAPFLSRLKLACCWFEP